MANYAHTHTWTRIHKGPKFELSLAQTHTHTRHTHLHLPSASGTKYRHRRRWLWWRWQATALTNSNMRNWIAFSYSFFFCCMRMYAAFNCCCCRHFAIVCASRARKSKAWAIIRDDGRYSSSIAGDISFTSAFTFCVVSTFGGGGAALSWSRRRMNVICFLCAYMLHGRVRCVRIASHLFDDI